MRVFSLEEIYYFLSFMSHKQSSSNFTKSSIIYSLVGKLLTTSSIKDLTLSVLVLSYKAENILFFGYYFAGRSGILRIGCGSIDFLTGFLGVILLK